MKKLALLVLCLISAGNVYAKITLLNAYKSPPVKSAIQSLTRNGVTYIRPDELSKTLNLKSYSSIHSKDLVISIGRNRIKFTANNHFVLANGIPLNFLHPTIDYKGKIYVPLSECIARLKDLFPARFVPYKRNLIYISKDFNVIQAFSEIFNDNITIELLLAKELEYSYKTTTTGKLSLAIENGKVNPDLFRADFLPQGINGVNFTYESNILKMELSFPANTEIISVSSAGEKIIIKTTGGALITRKIKENLQKVKEKWKFDTIVIDPGHGGKDPGAIGPRGTYEKNIVLDVSKRLAKLINDRTDMKAILTRKDDRFIPLYQRGKIANKANGKLFISIHCNASRDRRARGFQAFFLSPARNQQALQVAMLENAAIEYEEDQSLYQNLTDENYILMAMTQSNNVRASETLGEHIVNYLGKYTKLKNRGIDQAGFYVLYGANMPSILVEIAFISNRNEEKKLRSRKFRSSVANALFHSIVEFCREMEEEP